MNAKRFLKRKFNTKPWNESYLNRIECMKPKDGYVDLEQRDLLPEEAIAFAEAYHKHKSKKKAVYAVVSVSSGLMCGCFSSKDKAEKYKGDNDRLYIKKIKVE